MLLIHDLDNDQKDLLEKSLGDDVKIFSKEIDDIHPCLGCFNCWLKTPGRCVINDSYTEMPKYIKENDKLVIISEIRYGSYSPYIKRVIERSIGFLLPFFRFVNGEIHHSVRYKEVPKMIFIGYSNSEITEDSKKTFRDLIKGNAINFGCSEHETFIVKDINEIKDILSEI